MRFRYANIGAENQNRLLKCLPQTFGVYSFLDQKGSILYIGKALNLKRRVSSYFRCKTRSIKNNQLIDLVFDIEVITTQNETEALLLENNLIKSKMPPFNIKLKDEKTYPYVHLSADKDFPRLSVCWKNQYQTGEFYGPFVSKKLVYRLLDLLQRIFGIRDCHNTVFKNRARPCLQYEIARCHAPCTHLISAETYQENIEHVRYFLQGKSDYLKDFCTQEMLKHAEKKAYEQAAFYRDRLKDIHTLFETQSVCQPSGNYDVYGIAQHDNQYCIAIVWVRSGDVIDYKNIFIKSPMTHSLSHSLTQVIQHYMLNTLQFQYDQPNEILVSHLNSEQKILEIVLRDHLKRSCKIRTYTRGKLKKFIDLALHHAQQALQGSQRRGAHCLLTDSSLKMALNLTQVPQHIECFDISHFQGSATVGGCVVFDAKGPLKKSYRAYQVRTAQKSDDCAAIYEVVKRRYMGGNQNSIKPLPDLMIIDGGKAQLRATAQALETLNLSDCKLMAISKGLSRKPGLETLHFENGTSLALCPHGSAAHWLQFIRDEAHAFSIKQHRKRQKNKSFSSLLEMISGIGPQRREALLRHFIHLKALKSSNTDELQKVPGISKQLAMEIYTFFQTQGH
jgi:excinuclease ABC subunit C